MWPCLDLPCPPTESILTVTTIRDMICSSFQGNSFAPYQFIFVSHAGRVAGGFTGLAMDTGSGFLHFTCMPGIIISGKNVPIPLHSEHIQTGKAGKWDRGISRRCGILRTTSAILYLLRQCAV